MEIASAVERMLLPGGYLRVKKIGETYNPDTLIIHDTAVCLYFRLDRLLYA